MTGLERRLRVLEGRYGAPTREAGAEFEALLAELAAREGTTRGHIIARVVSTLVRHDFEALGGVTRAERDRLLDLARRARRREAVLTPAKARRRLDLLATELAERRAAG